MNNNQFKTILVVTSKYYIEHKWLKILGPVADSIRSSAAGTITEMFVKDTKYVFRDWDSPESVRGIYADFVWMEEDIVTEMGIKDVSNKA